MQTLGIIVLAASALMGVVFLATVVVLSPEARSLSTRVRVAMALVDAEDTRDPRAAGLPGWLPVLALAALVGFLAGLLLTAIGLLL